jgi:hypothetical protein
MKNAILMLLIFLVKFSAAREENKFLTLNEALNNPALATHLTVNCNEKESEKFIRNVKKLRQVRSLRIEGGTAATDWDAIFKAAKDLEWLKELQLSWIEMKEVPPAFNDLCLERLEVNGCRDLSYNALFISLSGQNASLLALALNNNELNSMPAAAASIKSLRSVTITENPALDAGEVIDVLQQLPFLSSLSLKDNDLRSVPSSVTALTSLVTLDISGNYIEKIPSAMVSMKAIDTLYIHDNILENPMKEAEKLAAMDLKYVSLDDDLDKRAVFALRQKSPGLRIEIVQEQATFTSGQGSSFAQPVFHKHSLVKPPLPELTMKPNVSWLDAEQGGTIAHKSGTRITIPAASLVYADGTPVTGSVSVSYREFSKPLDILLSGIPMTYDSGGAINQFETAGMFELYASQGDKELFLKPGATIDLEMKSPDSASTYNFYALDEKSSNWSYLGPGGEVTTKSTKALSDAWRVYARSLPFKPNGIDSLLFHERYADTAYFYLDKKEDRYRRRTNSKKTREEYFYQQSPIILCAVRPEKGDPKGIVKFQVKHKKSNKKSRKWKTDYHKELKHLDDVVLVLDGNMSRSEFRRDFVRKKRYNDLRVDYTPGSSSVRIELKNANGFQAINATLYAQDDNASMKKAKRQMNTRYNLYKMTLNNEQKQFDRNLRKNRQRTAKNYAQRKERAWSKAYMVMSKEEKQMTKEQWMQYYNEMLAMEADAATSGQVITRNLSISGFGIYNCDQIKRLQNPVQVFARYRNEKSEPLEWHTTYVIDKRIRGVLTYNNYSDDNEKRASISLDPNNTQAIVVVGRSGRIGVLTGEEVKKLDTGKKHLDITVKEASSLTSMEEMQKLLGLQ